MNQIKNQHSQLIIHKQLKMATLFPTNFDTTMHSNVTFRLRLRLYKMKSIKGTSTCTRQPLNNPKRKPHLNPYLHLNLGLHPMIAVVSEWAAASKKQFPVKLQQFSLPRVSNAKYIQNWIDLRCSALLFIHNNLFDIIVYNHRLCWI